MNGDSRKSFAVALVAFTVGATIAAILGNTKARESLTARGKKLLRLVDN